MSEIPYKYYYAGTDIETMTREELIEVIKEAIKEKEMFALMHKSSIEMNAAFRTHNFVQEHKA